MKRSDWENAKYKENGQTKETYINSQGFKMALPVYYRNKIYTEEEREKLWIEKLDKESPMRKIVILLRVQEKQRSL